MHIGPDSTREEFIAHALAIEFEAARTLRELEACFADRHQDELARLCRQLASLEQEHYESLVEHGRGLALPEVDFRQYAWLETAESEDSPRELVYHVASPRVLLEMALKAEQRAAAVFARVAREARDPDVATLARQLADDEGEHVRWVTDALARTPKDLHDWHPLIEGGTVPSLALGAERRGRPGPAPKDERRRP